MYKVDLGVGERFNKEYAHKVLDKIRTVDERLQKKGVNSESDERKRLEEEISEYDSKIEKYSILLEDLKSHREALLKELEVASCSTKELEAQKNELISRLIGRKVQ